MIRIYITRFTHTGVFGNYIVSNPMIDKFDTMENSGKIELSCYYADQDSITRLPKTDVVICVLRGGAAIDNIQLSGVQRLPTGKKDKLLSTLTAANKTKVRNILETIDPDVDTTQFVTIGDVILYIIRSVQPNFTRFGNGYDEGDFE